MELPRQADHRQKTQQRLRDESHRRRVFEQGARRIGDVQLVIAQPHPRKQPNRHDGDQLDHRLQRDGQHHAVMVFGGIHLAGAEQSGEQGHQQRHIQRRIGKDAAPGAAMPGQHLQAHRHRFVLQRQIRDDADQRDHCHQRGQPPRAAVARGNEIGDGHGVFGACDQRQPLDDAPAEQQQQQRAEIDRQIADTVAHRRAHRAVERPRRAVHRQCQAVDRRPQPRPLRIHRPTIAPPRHPEQQRGVTQRDQQQYPARDQWVS